jgi:hypothetical protein
LAPTHLLSLFIVLIVLATHSLEITEPLVEPSEERAIGDLV